VTVNGLGERAGNAALEEVVMALRTRGDHFGVDTRVNSSRIVPTSRLVSSLTGLAVQRNKAVVGENAFAHEAGIHVHGVLSHRETYEIMRPEEVGYGESRIVIGKHTGHHAVEARIRQLGYRLSREQLERVRETVKGLADRKKQIFDADVEAIVRDELAQVEETFVLEGFQVMTGRGLTPMATVTLSRGGEKVTDASAGDGPVDAIFTAIDRITGESGVLLDYRIEAVTGGREAMGEVYITVRFGEVEISAHGASPDVLEASALAYLQAVNRLVARREAAASGRRGSGPKRGK
jgi:2-isopropylmalate synthase